MSKASPETLERLAKAFHVVQRKTLFSHSGPEGMELANAHEAYEQETAPAVPVDPVAARMDEIDKRMYAHHERLNDTNRRVQDLNERLNSLGDLRGRVARLEMDGALSKPIGAFQAQQGQWSIAEKKTEP